MSAQNSSETFLRRVRINELNLQISEALIAQATETAKTNLDGMNEIAEQIHALSVELIEECEALSFAINPSYTRSK